MTAWNSTLPLPTKPMKRRKPMNKVSKKRKAEQSRRDRWGQAVFERDGHKCQCESDTCPYKNPDKQYGPYDLIIDAHHYWEKGSHSKWRFVLENGVALLRYCHRLVHDKLIELPIDRDALKDEFNRGVGTPIE